IEDGTLTTRTFRRLFGGSELVVAGKLREDIDISLKGNVNAISINGTIAYNFEAIIIHLPPIIISHLSNMERLWAYLAIQQLLDEDTALDYDHNNKSLTSPQKEQALQLALEYSFVTSLTSLVVVKPNVTSPLDAQDASQANIDESILAEILAVLGHSLIGLSDFESETTTTDPTKICLKGINDVTWLASNRTVNVATGVDLQVAGNNETNTEFSSCVTSDGEEGHCRHLQYCVLNIFTTEQEDFLPYLCHIDRLCMHY
ncbi:hypothetical protein L9F63_018701, partial [Diploptera punctata]